MVWAFPVSLAATQGIEFSFFSSAYLDVSVQRVCFLDKSKINGLSHSEIYDYNGYLRLIVAYRSLSRPSSPLRAKASAVCSYVFSLCSFTINDNSN